MQANNNNNNDNDENPAKSPPKVALPSGIQEGYDPYNDPLVPVPVKQAPPALPPPPPAPIFLEPKESAESGSNEPKAPPKAVPSGAVVPMVSPQQSNTGQSKSPGAVRGGCVPPNPPPKVADDDVESAIPIVLEEGLGDKEYFHGLLPREDIEAMLRRNGDFVLRVTELREGPKKATRELCLSVHWHGNVHHFLLRPNTNKRYFICNPAPGERLQEFDTVLEMVTYYQHKGQAFGIHKIVLITPIFRQEWELRHEEITCKVKLGSGAFGDVFSGELKRKNKKVVKVAIKMLKGEKVDKKKILEIMNEARVMRNLKHKHVVRCYGVAADIEPLMILMELINGGALDVYLKCNTNKVSLHQRVNMSFDAALGLEYVHSKGVLHRDIAARNCLYDSKNLKVSDFGLSVVSDKYNLDPTQKAPVRWLSPEVFKTHIYTKAADVWAYGVLVWEIFNDSQEPYKGWTGMQIRDTVLESGSKLTLPDWAGPYMAKVIKETFEPDPLMRISMSEVVRKIEKFAPKRERDDIEEESQDDSKLKGNKKLTAVVPRVNLPKFFDKPKELPKDDKDQSDKDQQGRTSKSKMTKFKPFSPFGSSTPTGKGNKKGGSKEAGKTMMKKIPTKEPFKCALPSPKNNKSKDGTLSKEKFKKRPPGGGSLKVRRQTREEKQDDSSSVDNKKMAKLKGDDAFGKTKEPLRRKSNEKPSKPSGKLNVAEARVKIPTRCVSSNPPQRNNKPKKFSSNEKDKKKDNSSSGEQGSNEERRGGSLEALSKSKLPMLPVKPKAKER